MAGAAPAISLPLGRFVSGAEEVVVAVVKVRVNGWS
jgi:hypothetical protein